MRVSVFGLGYVGAVSCACLARAGHEVIGVDLNPGKVAAISEGRSPIVEDQLDDIIAHGVRSGRLRATTDGDEAVRDTDVSLVCVGTPSRPNGSLDLAAVQRVSQQIGGALRSKADPHLVVVRSTVLPGTVRGVVMPTLERTSGRRIGRGLDVCFNPEFLREGSSVRDYYNPPYTLIGSDGPEIGQLVSRLYDDVQADTIYTTIETSELVKYVCNAFHALKITFANEIGMVAQALGVDSHAVMDLVCRDTKLNISPKYLKPGFAFGGSCLPKDLRALLHRARTADVELPLIQSILESNRRQIDRAVEIVLQTKRRRVTQLGLSFKTGTDDLRESPLVAVAEALIGKGLDVRIYDSSVSLARLTGVNKEYIEGEIPHIASLLVGDLSSAVAAAEVLIVGHAAPEFDRLPHLCREGQIVIDFVRIPGLSACSGLDYRGLVW